MTDSAGKRVSRRELLRAAVGIAMPTANRTVATNPVVEENRKPGTTDWQLTYVRSEKHRSKLVEGYCSHTSVRPGETLDLFLSADPATDVTVDVYRMGYYGGKGGRHVGRVGPFTVKPQPTPEVGPNRLRECRWARTTSVAIPADWVSGVYLGKLSCSGHRYQSYVIFVVRDDRKADLLFQTSDTTWQAYNRWPDEYSLYESDAPHRPHSASTWISYDRPYGKYPQVVDQPLSQGSGEFLLWEYPLCHWLEEHGYDVTYWSNIDTHADRAGLDRVKCFLSVAHDEYWSLEMYRNVESGIANGLSVGWLCGNSVHGVVPLNQVNSAGRPHRIIYRTGRFGGTDPEQVERNPYLAKEPWERHGPDEAKLIGGRVPDPPNGSASWTVTNADHWIFDDTGMRNGDEIPGLVGWEFHDGAGDIPGLEVIAAGKTLKAGGDESSYTATVYPGPRGNWVFNAGTIFWNIGLSRPPGLVPPYSHEGRPHGVDERVRRITVNFFRRCGIDPPA